MRKAEGQASGANLREQAAGVPQDESVCGSSEGLVSAQTQTLWELVLQKANLQRAMTRRHERR